jgi:methyl-accepting chemotaxis protein
MDDKKRRMASISNIKIGRKLALANGGSILLILCLTGIAIWSIRAIHRDMMASETESHMTALAERIAGDVGGIAQRVATMTLSRQAGTQIMAQLLAKRAEYMATFEEFRSMQVTEEDKRQLAQMDRAAARWRSADNNLIAMLQAGNPSGAAILHREEVVPRFNELGSTIDDYVKYREQKLAELNGKTETLISWTTLVMICVGLISVSGAVVLSISLARNIVKPLLGAVENLNLISRGDLSKDSSPELQSRGDEIGVLARSMQTMTVALRKMVQEISSGIQVLSSSATELMASSTRMTSGSRQACDKSHSVAAAAEEMSSNITSVAAGMEQTTTNLYHVSTATEQMTATIGEIAQNSDKARRITDEATRQAARITEQINQLGVAAREIGKVTQTITEISSQTNLLALNATIEAARAGSAGKGFAVVATEIKALAQQTTKATEDIKTRIAGVQSATAGGIAEIEKVSKVIVEVSAIVASIAAAIEEQATATKDIARNIAEASVGMTDANSRVSETSQVSREIAKDIVTVDQSSKDMAMGSDQVRNSAGELSSVAETLRVTVSNFRTGILAGTV